MVPGYIEFGMVGFDWVGVWFWFGSVSVLVALIVGCVRYWGGVPSSDGIVVLDWWLLFFLLFVVSVGSLGVLPDVCGFG